MAKANSDESLEGSNLIAFTGYVGMALQNDLIGISRVRRTATRTVHQSTTILRAIQHRRPQKTTLIQSARNWLLPISVTVSIYPSYWRWSNVEELPPSLKGNTIPFTPCTPRSCHSAQDRHRGHETSSPNPPHTENNSEWKQGSTRRETPSS